jgi:hypothetical protein
MTGVYASCGTAYERSSGMTDQWTTVTDLPTPFHDHQVSVEGIERPDGTWAGRVMFRHGGAVLATDQETSQPNREALAYWATGLEAVYLEGAFERAKA